MLRLPLLSAVRRLSTAKRSGLFGYDVLRTPDGFKTLNKQVRKRCDQLYKEIISGSNKSRAAVHLFDDMSNEICCVADLAECTRVLHTDPAFAEQAEDVMRDFTELVETLNTSRELYDALKNSLQTEANLDEVDRRVIDLFLSDFEKSGIQLEKKGERQEFVRLSSTIFDASSVFMNNINIPPKLNLLEKHKYTSCDTPHPMTTDGKLRDWAYNKFYEFSNEQEGCLRFLINSRHQLAKLTGYESFAHRAQDHMLLQNFDSAYQFLHDLIKKTQPEAEYDLEQLLIELRTEDRLVSQVAEWDLLYLMSKLRARNYPDGDIMQYFSLGSVMKGFETIVQHLYGMEFKISYPASEEIWRGNTQKIDVFRQCEFLGTIYLDINTRPHKAVGDSHFTIRCSKLLESGQHQTPIAVLSLSFTNGQCATGLNDLFMSTYEVQNFFHEMGHAMHSMLGRTRFQHTAGTRCATDMAEIPSNLMECFFKNPKVMTTVFKNRLGETMPESDAQTLISSRKMFHSLETIQQAVLCLLDLELHGPAAQSIIDGTCTSSDVLNSIWNRALPSLKRNPRSAYAHRFGHLVQYAAKYYAYQVAQSAAELIWETQFESNPFCSIAGERWARVQSFGGELPSNKLLEMAIGYAPTSAQLTGHSIRSCDVGNADALV
uniref:Peptidase_M3 domain-containing protein n=1 Tax=Steinernema glaseri TaxID=37863 RepID=A0A1I7Y8I7_9BILA